MLQAHVHERLQAQVRNRRLGAGLWVLLLGGLVASIAGAATLHFACAVRIHPPRVLALCLHAHLHRVPHCRPRATSLLLPHHLRTTSALRPLSPPPPPPPPAPLPQTGGAAP